jgi:hypothetical protein
MGGVFVCEMERAMLLIGDFGVLGCDAESRSSLLAGLREYSG